VLGLVFDSNAAIVDGADGGADGVGVEEVVVDELVGGDVEFVDLLFVRLDVGFD